MRILFRVDASPKIGLGHLIRSLSVADVLRTKYKAEVCFASTLTNEIRNYVLPRGFKVIEKKPAESELTFLLQHTDAFNALYIDSLHSYTFEELYNLKDKIYVVLVQNFCEGRYACHSFVLPSAHHPFEIIKDKKWEENQVNFYHGLDYVLLSSSLRRLPKKKPSGFIKTIGISTGGSDPKGVLLKLLNILQHINLNQLTIKVLLGKSFIKISELYLLKRQLPANYKFYPYEPTHWLDVDLAITTFGVTSYEVTYLQIPSLTVGHAESNTLGSKIFAQRYQATVDLGQEKDLTIEKLKHTLEKILYSESYFQNLEMNTLHLIDGKGSKRVAGIVLEKGTST